MRKHKLAGVLFFCHLMIAGVGVGASEPKIPLKVLSQNLYVGTDLLRVLSVQDPLEIPGVTGELFKEIERTKFQERAKKFSELIAEHQPDVIGLQEVSMILRQSPGDFLAGNPVAANDVVWDFLQILLDEMSGLGLSYQIASVYQGADIELPMLLSYSPTETYLDDVRLQDRDVLLVKNGMNYERPRVMTFNAQQRIEMSGQSISFDRGAQSINLIRDHQRVQIVNTHLEVNTAEPFLTVQREQAKELIRFSDSAGNINKIIIGDLNSSPAGAANNPWNLLIQNGYSDSWAAVYDENTEDGFTCCQSPDLRNAVSELGFRIDHILFNGTGLQPVDSFVIGVHDLDRTPGGLWISDHAGVMTVFQ